MQTSQENKASSKIYSKHIINISKAKFLQYSQERYAEASVYYEDDDETQQNMIQIVEPEEQVQVSVKSKEEVQVSDIYKEEVQVGFKYEQVQVGFKYEQVQVGFKYEQVQVGFKYEQVQVGFKYEQVQVAVEQQHKLLRQTDKTQLSLKIKRFLTQVLDKQTMNLIDNYLIKSCKFCQNQQKLSKHNASLYQDLLLFKYLKDNQQNIQKQRIKSILMIFKRQRNEKKHDFYYYNRVRRILSTVTMQQIIKCIRKDKKININNLQKTLKQFLNQIWDSNIQSLIKQYIKKNDINKEIIGKMFKSNFSLVQDCKILLIMKENSQKLQNQICQIGLKFIKSKSTQLIKERIKLLKVFLTKDLLIFSIIYDSKISSFGTYFQFQIRQFVSQINFIMNFIILQKTQKLKNIYNSRPTQLALINFTNIDDFIICLTFKKLFGSASLKFICLFTAKKIKKSQEQIISRLNVLKQKYSMVMLQKLQNNIALNKKKLKQNKKKQKSNQNSRKQVKLQEDCWDINYEDQNLYPMQMQNKNIQHFVNVEADINQIDLIVDKLNKLRNISIIEILKSIKIQKQHQSTLNMHSQVLPSKTERSFHYRDQQLDLQLLTDKQLDQQLFQILNDDKGNFEKEKIRQLLIRSNSQRHFFYVYDKINRILIMTKQQKVINCIFQSKQANSQKHQKSAKQFLEQVLDQNVQMNIRLYIEKNEKDQETKNKIEKNRILLFQDCKILLAMKGNTQKSIKEMSQLIHKVYLNRPARTIQQRIKYIKRFLTKDILVFLINHNFTILNVGNTCQLQTKKFIQQINYIIKVIVVKQIVKQQKGFKQQVSLFSFIDDLIICFFIKKFFGYTSQKPYFLQLKKKQEKPIKRYIIDFDYQKKNT